MATTPYIRELTPPEWIVLATLYHHALKSERGLLGENEGPLEQSVIAESLKPIDAPEALSTLEKEPILCIEHPLTDNNKPKIRHWDTTRKGDAVFAALSGKAVEKAKSRLKAEQPTLTDAVIGQRRRDIATLERVLKPIFEMKPELLPKQKPAPKARGAGKSKEPQTASST